jgi:hypothetical protein
VEESLKKKGISWRPDPAGLQLLILDASYIELCMKMYDWAKYTTTKGAVKLHTVTDGYLPVLTVITDGKAADVTVAERMMDCEAARRREQAGGGADALIVEGEDEFAPSFRQSGFPKGSVVVMDRGYVKYSLFKTMEDLGLYFVTRAKVQMSYVVKEVRPLPENAEPSDPKAAVVTRDEIIRLAAPKANAAFDGDLRLVTAHDPAGGRTFQFLTNLMKPEAHVISAVYKARWQIESFFKQLKNFTRIKSFFGTSENAVRTQIFACLIASLLFKYIKLIAAVAWDYSTLRDVVRFSMFQYWDLIELVNNPTRLPRPPTPGIPASAVFSV